MKNIYKKDSGERKMILNDIFMRELGLDLDENDYLYDMDDGTIFQINEKFIKYTDDIPYPVIRSDEIDFNTLENYRLAETLFSVYIMKMAAIKGFTVISYTQSIVKGSKKGRFVLNYKSGKEIKSKESDTFENESVRVLNLICKLNHTDHMYDFDSLDIIVLRDKEV